MNNNHIRLILQIFTLISIVAGIAVSQPVAAGDSCQDPLVAPSGKEKKVVTDASGSVDLIDEDTLNEADSLAGTCPKGFHCSCPGCPLYSDLDEDTFCDLGEEPEES